MILDLHEIGLISPALERNVHNELDAILKSNIKKAYISISLNENCSSTVVNLQKLRKIYSVYQHEVSQGIGDQQSSGRQKR